MAAQKAAVATQYRRPSMTAMMSSQCGPKVAGDVELAAVKEPGVLDMDVPSKHVVDQMRQDHTAWKLQLETQEVA